jgi:hypothetical protein
MKKEIEERLDAIVKEITSDAACKFMKEKMFSDNIDIPCNRWSTLNKFIVHLYETKDARGVAQWRKVGRQVIPEAVKINILVPMFYSGIKDKNKGKDQDKTKPKAPSAEVSSLSGFASIPVYRVEDTTGKPLDYQVILKNFDIDSLPLIDVAKRLGVEVKAGISNERYASFHPSAKKIIMNTDDPQTFLHELSHAVDFALPNRNADYSHSEIVAELSSAFLGSLYGVKVNLKNTQAYIQNYSGRGHVVFKVMKALDRVKAIYTFIESHKNGPRKPLTAPTRQKSQSLFQSMPV